MNNSDANQAEQLRENAVMQSVILPNELRIGNIIKTPRGIKAINEIGCKETNDNEFDYYIRAKYLHEGYFLSSCEPLKITEEWFFKLGFFKYNNAYVLEKPTENIMNFKFSIWNDFTYNSSEFPIELKYVHQLQNLYFALTQRELTVA